jgi:MFS family permease
MFIGLGAITMLWLWPWFSAAYANAASNSPHPSSHPAHEEASAIPYLRILRQRDFWGAALGQFSLNFTFYFAFIWMPSYLVQVGGFPVTDMASIVAAIYGIYALVTAFCGKLADRHVARGASATRVWKSVVLVSGFGLALTMSGCALLEPRVAVWLLGLSAIFFGLGTPALYTVTATLPGPRAAGRWAGAQNMAGQFAGVLSPLVTGMLIDRTGNYDWAFLVAAAAALVSMLGWCVIVRRVEAVDWDADGTVPAQAVA